MSNARTPAIDALIAEYSAADHRFQMAKENYEVHPGKYNLQAYEEWKAKSEAALKALIAATRP
jgi:hypothetical protein